MAFLLRLLALVLFVILFQGVYAIEIGFSASNGGESVSIWDTYMVDDTVSVSESASATFNSVGMTDSREISGSGDINTQQVYSGSGGYTSTNYLYSEDTSSVEMSSSVTVSPNTLDMEQSFEIDDGQNVNMVLNAQKDASSEIKVTMGSGDITDTATVSVSGTEVAVRDPLSVDGDDIVITSSASDGVDDTQVVTTVYNGLFDGNVHSFTGQSMRCEQLGTLWGSFDSTSEANGEFVNQNKDFRGEDGLGAGFRPRFDFNMNAGMNGLNPEVEGEIDFFLTPDTASLVLHEAVHDAIVGETIYLDPGEYDLTLAIDKQISLIGAGSGSDPSTNTVINSVILPGSPVTSAIAIICGGSSETERVIVKDLRATGVGDGVMIGGIEGDVEHVTLENIASVDNAGFGVIVNAGRVGAGRDNEGDPISISDVTISDCTITGSGNNGMVMSTRAGTISDVTISDSTITDSGNNGMVIVGEVGGEAGTISDVTISDSTITGSSSDGIRIAGVGTIENVAVHGTNIYDNDYMGINNNGVSVIDATNNWWGYGGTGDEAGCPGKGGNNDVSIGGVTYDPWSTTKIGDDWLLCI